MKREEIKKHETSDLVWFQHEWGWDLHQLILMRQYDLDDHFIDIPVVVTAIKYNNNYPPITTVGYYNKWRSGEWGGEIFIDLMIGRYTSPEPLQQKHIDVFKDYDDKKQLFYVEEKDGKHYKVYPFVGEENES